MNRIALEGCCAASWFFNLGGAHDVPEYSDYDTFLKDMSQKGYNSLNICVVNSYQDQAHEYLKRMGWKAAYTKKKPFGEEVTVYIIDSDTFAAATEEHRRELEREYLAKKQKEREERLKKANQAATTAPVKKVNIPKKLASRTSTLWGFSSRDYF